MVENYEGFYQGSGSVLNPDYNVGFKMNAAMLGFPGSAQTANQLGEAVKAIKTGAKVFEVNMVEMGGNNISETIPKQHFDEMRALMKLTGVKPSVHAPLLDPAGFNERGWAPDGRADNERRLFEVIKKAQKLDPTGNLPIVFHASNGAPGSEWRPSETNEEKKEGAMIRDSSSMVNQKTGRVEPIRREMKWRPEHFTDDARKAGVYGEQKLFTAEGSIGSVNRGEWENKLTELAQMNKHAEELIGAAPIALRDYVGAYRTKDGIFKEDSEGNVHKLPGITGDRSEYLAQMGKAEIFLENAELSFNSAFDQAYEYGSEAQRKELAKLAENYSKASADANSMVLAPYEKKRILDNTIVQLKNLTSGVRIGSDGKLVRDDDFDVPEVWKLGEDFALDKAAKTFGNLAVNSYKEFKDKAPVMAIENLYQGMAFSRAEDLKKLVEDSRKNFVEEMGGKIGKKKAEKFARDKIGVTWDVGHLNIMKKKGFTDKDIIKQTELINEDKSMVKHIHLTDNFGFADTHLIPGMGNVPIKGILEELEKNGRFKEMRKIVEAVPGGVGIFGGAAHPMTMSAFGSPIYGMKNAPTWNQAVGIQGSYFAGYGTLNPQTHHSYFGAGFTNMPVELGGDMPGGGSRFGGTPMA